MASILTFPRTLRSAADDKMPHIGFSLTGKNKPDIISVHVNNIDTKLNISLLKLNCEKIVLDSFTENKKSHTLYFKEDFHIRGFHFMKDLSFG